MANNKRLGSAGASGMGRWPAWGLLCWVMLWPSLAHTLQAGPDMAEYQVRFQAIKNRGAISLGPVDAILQDSLGYIWLGGENGLVRFDGYQFQVYRNQPENRRSLSNNTIWAMAEDADHNLWIATEGGVNRYNRRTDDFSHYRHNPDDPLSLNQDTVRAIHVTRSGHILVGTYGGGAALLDPASGKVRRWQHRPGDRNSLAGNKLWAVHEDLAGKFWFGTEDAGVSVYDPGTDSFTHFNSAARGVQRIAHDTVRAITQDRAGDIWLGTDGGVYRLQGNAVAERWRHDPVVPTSLGNDIVWDVFEDSHGEIWVATDGGGLNLIRRNSAHVRRFVHDSRDPTSLSSNVARQIIEDRDGDIWVASFPSGVNVFHRAAQWVTHIRYQSDRPGGLSQGSVLAFLEDMQGGLWLGTDGGGLNRWQPDGSFTVLRRQADGGGLSANAVLSLAQDHQGDIWIGTWGGGVNRLNPTTGEVRHYLADPESADALSSPNVWALLVDHDGDVWLGTEGGGLNRYDRQRDAFERFGHGVPDDAHTAGNIVWSLYQDAQGMIWIGTNAGLSRLHKASGRFHHWQSLPGDPLSLSDNNVLSIISDRSQQLWVGTRAGLNRLHSNGNGFHVIRSEDGLFNDNITAMVQDADGYLWLGTADGLARLDTANYALRTYNQSDWARGKFNYGAALKLYTGELVFGSIQGLIRFSPNRLGVNTRPPPLVFTDFQIFNSSPRIGQPGSPLRQSLAFTDHLVLDYRQSVFSFEFAALSFYGTESNRYAYRLEGFDSHWNYIGTERRATYTNLEPGEYRLRVKAANHEGIWNEEGLSLRLTLTPAPWRTWWAYWAYISVLAVVVWLYLRGHRLKIAQARAVNERLRELDKLKDDFLANTSHELRTPLNGIIGLAESLMGGIAGDLSPQVRANLQMIINSGRRLSALVNDILDFARLKNNRVPLQMQPLNLRQLVTTVTVLSRPLVGKKDLDITNHVDEQLPAVLADDNRLQQILYNLIGNAIKFTDSGSVVISAQQKGDHIWVSVTDTGSGIAEDQLADLLESLEVEHHRRQYGGTGLGLAVTRQLVSLHGGELRVSSQVGRGSTFSFSLKSAGTQPSHISEAERSLPLNWPAAASLATDTVSMRLRDSESAIADNRRFRLLIVDDEPVNRQVLVNQLSLQGYELVEAESGAQALEAVQQQGPFDLVLLDVMMPRVSGYEVCAAIRRQYSLSELPIVLLTAKDLIADLVDGFEVGANDFLTKPIAKGELVSRVRTHLQLLDVHRHLEEKVKARTREVEQANKVLETLDGIVATINQEVIFVRLLDVLQREARRLFPAAERTLYWVHQPQLRRFEAVAHQGYQPAQLQSLTLGEEELQQRYADAQTLATDIWLLKPGPQTPGARSLANLAPSRAELALGVRFDTKLVGYLCLVNLNTQHAFDQCDLSTLVRFHAHTQSALLKARLMETLKAQNAKLQDASLTDPLTGLRNRRYLTQYVDSDIALTLRSHRARLPDQPLPANADLLFFLLDIDHFKQINDEHGHAAGDRALVQIKQIMQQVFRESDFLVRWGGEEFLMVARFSNRKAAPLMAERLRQAVKHHVFDLGDGVQLQRTCCIGFACFPYLTSDALAFSWNQVVDIAEQCLYAAKRSQRDCWVGLEAHAPAENELSFQAIATRPQQLIAEHKLLLHTNLPPDQSLSW